MAFRINCMAKAATKRPNILVIAFIDLSPRALDMGVANENRTSTIRKMITTDPMVIPIER